MKQAATGRIMLIGDITTEHDTCDDRPAWCDIVGSYCQLFVGHTFIAGPVLWLFHPSSTV